MCKRVSVRPGRVLNGSSSHNSSSSSSSSSSSCKYEICTRKSREGREGGREGDRGTVLSVIVCDCFVRDLT